jgi:glycosyltransferase involved in cell wall biosynthesis
VNIAIAIQLPLLQQGGVEVLAREFLCCAKPEDRVYLVSKDTREDLNKSLYESKIADHLQVPEGVISREWMNDMVGWLQKNEIEICHFHLTGTYGWDLWTGKVNAVIAVAYAGIRTYTTNHQVISHFDRAYYPRSWIRNLLGFLRHWPIKLRQLMAVEREICVSRHDLGILKRCYPFLSWKLEQVYHSRLDESVGFEGRNEQPLILNVATVAYRKGQHVLVRAFARIAASHPDWRLRLVGYIAEKECHDEIERIIQEHHIEGRILFHGPDTEPTKHYMESSIYVQPSTIEGLGLSLQEAMFYGCACVGSDTGGIPELVDEPDVGLLFETGSDQELAQKLLELIDSSELRLKLGRNARASVIKRGMTRKAMIDAYHSLYGAAKA